MQSIKLRKKGRYLAVLLGCLSLAWLGIRLANVYSLPSDLRSAPQGELADCPDRPNCVCTSATKPDSRIAPIELVEPAGAAQLKLEEIIADMPNSRLVVSQDNYVHAEFRSLVFGFVDDLELLIDERERLIYLRSASRVGYSDLGVNRKRVEELRRLYLESR